LEPSYNDRFILCTDGLTDLVKEEEILEVSQESDNPENLCGRLVDMALQRGAPDNTTVLAIFLKDVERPRLKPLRKARYLLGEALTRRKEKAEKLGP
jgi:serine/threonine protein phosphatase PrpC